MSLGQTLLNYYSEKLILLYQGKVRLEKTYTTDLTTTQAQIFGPNQNRVGLVFVNLHGSQTANVWIDSTVTTSLGMRVGAAGGKINLVFPEDAYLVESPWHGIASAAATSFFAAAFEVYRSR